MKKVKNLKENISLLCLAALFFCIILTSHRARPVLAPALRPDEVAEVLRTCRAVRWRTLEKYVTVFPGGRAFVATGDIDDMWLRDSAVQMRPYLRLRRAAPLVQAVLRAQAAMVLADPYAASFRKRWRAPTSEEAPLRRGGWVATGNWEVDSLAYFLHFVCDVGAPAARDASVMAAADLALEVLDLERAHYDGRSSPYRYAELPRGGVGAAAGYTGMVWGAFRPSDDAQTYGYNVPVNMFLHAALGRLRSLCAHPAFRAEASARPVCARARLADLRRTIRQGIERHGVAGGAYVYETDGLGNHTGAFDDANMPSLLSIPLTGYRYDEAAYRAARARVLSAQNPSFFRGPSFEGVGSPHTPPGHVWALAVVARALTAADQAELTAQFRYLLAMRCGSNAMHESVSAYNSASCTRPDFEWANSAFVQLADAFFPGACELPGPNWALLKHES